MVQKVYDFTIKAPPYDHSVFDDETWGLCFDFLIIPLVCNADMRSDYLRDIMRNQGYAEEFKYFLERIKESPFFIKKRKWVEGVPVYTPKIVDELYDQLFVKGLPYHAKLKAISDFYDYIIHFVNCEINSNVKDD